MRVTTGVGTLLVAAALVAGCEPGYDPKAPEPTGPAPEPTAAGALYGRIMRPDGRAANKATVALWQFDAADHVRAATAIASLGFFCLIPTDAFCPKPAHAKVSHTGGFSFTTEDMKDTPELQVTATLQADPGQQAPPATAVTVANAPDPQRVPDLVFWEPALHVGSDGSQNTTVSWPDLGALPHGSEVTYTVSAFAADETIPRPRQVAGPTAQTSAVLEGWQYEDVPSRVVVTAQTTVGEATYSYRSAAVAVANGQAPPSRGLPCLADDAAGRLRPTAGPCPLTDGDLGLHHEVLLPGECSRNSSPPCQTEVTHRRLCVDLGQPRQVGLVVLRTPFGTADLTIELSSDGLRFTKVGQPSDGEDWGRRIYPLRVQPARSAAMVCVTRQYDFAGAILTELSVW
jgi:hypothetical protein